MKVMRRESIKRCSGGGVRPSLVSWLERIMDMRSSGGRRGPRYCCNTMMRIRAAGLHRCYTGWR